MTESPPLIVIGLNHWMENVKYNFKDVVTEQKASSGPMEGCDWLSSLPSPKLTTNRDPVSRKRKLVHETGLGTKRRRVGST